MRLRNCGNCFHMFSMPDIDFYYCFMANCKFESEGLYSCCNVHKFPDEGINTNQIAYVWERNDVKLH